jgi:hypothetical protein
MSTIPLPGRMYQDARGYFAFPLTRDDDGIDGLVQWKALAGFVEDAKRGRFELIPPLLERYDHDADWVRRGAYVRVLGDAGPDALLERMHRELLPDVPVDYRFDFAETLFYWGRLDIVPTLLEIWHSDFKFQDAYYIPPRLGLLLEEEPRALDDFPIEGPAADADAFRDRVLARHAELCNQHGDHGFVFRGRLLDVEWIARRALQDLSEGKLDPEMRHKLEAMTGIDCSSFYASKKLQPLAAAVVLEDFLAGPAPSRFVPGRRYFFGHPLPASTATDDPLGPPMLR